MLSEHFSITRNFQKQKSRGSFLKLPLLYLTGGNVLFATNKNFFMCMRIFLIPVYISASGSWKITGLHSVFSRRGVYPQYVFAGFLQSLCFLSEFPTVRFQAGKENTTVCLRPGQKAGGEADNQERCCRW